MSKVGKVIFFILFGLAIFIHIPYVDIILGIDAIVTGIAIACGQ